MSQIRAKPASASHFGTVSRDRLPQGSKTLECGETFPSAYKLCNSQHTAYNNKFIII